MTHFKLTSESKVNSFGKTVYRIEAIEQFSMVNIGDKGGWVATESNIRGKGWVEEEAEVFDNAVVTNEARITQHAQIYGDATVSGRAIVLGHAQIYENAVVTDDTKLFGEPKIHGNAIIREGARVFGTADIHGTAEVFGRSRMNGGSWDKTPYQFRGSRGDISYVNTPDPSTFRIGCINESFTEWFKTKEAIAAKYGLTPEEFAEYSIYLNAAYVHTYPDSSEN